MDPQQPPGLLFAAVLLAREHADDGMEWARRNWQFLAFAAFIGGSVAITRNLNDRIGTIDAVAATVTLNNTALISLGNRVGDVEKEQRVLGERTTLALGRQEMVLTELKGVREDLRDLRNYGPQQQEPEGKR